MNQSNHHNKKYSSEKQKVRIAFLHANMALGGAEQWVVNMAIGLQQMGCYVKIFTPFFDENRCLDQMKDGSLDLEVRGNILPKKICGRFNALCIWIRLTLAAIYLLLFGGHYDLVIVDQISLPLPLLRLRFKTFFYCHWPDKLLCLERKGFLMKIYRFILDSLEEFTMLFANEVAVNSKFTQETYMKSFNYLTKLIPVKPKVIYPCIEPSHYETSTLSKKDLYTIKGLEALKGRDSGELRIITSLNRFETKKNIVLALKSYINFMEIYSKNHTKAETERHLLIIAGGYDTEVPECFRCFNQIADLAHRCIFNKNIFLLKNINSDERTILLNSANVLMYTPKNEHFGIVPVEGMVSGAIAICHKSGGPLESVNDGVTGFLLDNEDEEKWAEKLFLFFDDKNNFEENGINNSEIRERLKRHVYENFSVNSMMKDTYELWRDKHLLKKNVLRKLRKLPGWETNKVENRTF